MDRLQYQLQHWLDGKTVRVQRQMVTSALVVLCLTAAAGSLLGRNPISITLGSLCGLGMAFLLRDGFRLLPSGLQERWNLKSRYSFAIRRWVVAGFAVAVITVLIGVGNFVPYALGGAVSVCAFILLALLFLPTHDEAVQMEVEAQEAAAAAERAATVTDWNGDTPDLPAD